MIRLPDYFADTAVTDIQHGTSPSLPSFGAFGAKDKAISSI